jgi:uncharacterized ion transporter superfamily protein YfcC
MTEQGKGRRSALQIGLGSFVTAFVVLLLLMVGAGILTRVVPAGAYDRVTAAGRAMVVPDSYRPLPHPDYPVWRWFTAPIEVLFAPGNLTVITIILFLVFVGGAFAVVEQAQVLRHLLAVFVERFRSRRRLLMAAIMAFFMICGGVLGIYEEAVPLVVFVVPLALAMGWDSLTGLGMSLLALSFGFAAAVTNPFTIGVAQGIAGLPLFSGAWLRIIFFVATYAVVFLFVHRHARRVERDPASSPVYAEDAPLRARTAAAEAAAGADPAALGRACAWLAAWMAATVVFIVVATRIRALSDFAFPAVALFFLAAGVGSGLLARLGLAATLRAFAGGIGNIAPAIVLVLMATSVKQIIESGGIMDTILKVAAGAIAGSSPMLAAFLVYLTTLVLEFFVGSASAKAFLMMPVIAPLADLVGITRQTAVLAFDIADGFANMFYPSNALLLIALGLTVVGYPKWIRWTLGLQGVMWLVSMGFLAFAVAIHFGPF